MNYKIDGVEISHPEKIIFKKNLIKKIDIVNYYKEIAPFLLKEIKNKLISVIRCPGGAGDSCFFKKHPTNKSMANVKKVDGKEYFYITTTKQLIYQVQMGTIEFHCWGSTIKEINRPTTMIFDLDPDTNLPLNKLRHGALLLKEVLDKLNLKSQIKTSGGKGYHILVPIKKPYSWDEFAEISKHIALFLENKYPQLFTTNIKKENRKNKIFIDYLRNKKGATCVAPYSLRAREGAPISWPIAWENLNKIKPNEVNINNFKKYL